MEILMIVQNITKNQEKFYQQLVDLIGDRMCVNPPYVDKAEMGIPCSGDHDNHIYHTDLCPEGTLHGKDEYVFDRCLDSRIWDTNQPSSFSSLGHFQESTILKIFAKNSYRRIH